MPLDLSLRPTTGLEPGLVYQFAEGSWPGSIGDGVAIDETGFDFVEPYLVKAWPVWNGEARYGVTELPPEAREAFVIELRAAAERHQIQIMSPECHEYSGEFDRAEVLQEFEVNPGRHDELAALFDGLADWLEAAAKRGCVISLLGI